MYQIHNLRLWYYKLKGYCSLYTPYYWGNCKFCSFNFSINYMYCLRLNSILIRNWCNLFHCKLSSYFRIESNMNFVSNILGYRLRKLILGKMNNLRGSLYSFINLKRGLADMIGSYLELFDMFCKNWNRLCTTSWLGNSHRCKWNKYLNLNKRHKINLSSLNLDFQYLCMNLILNSLLCMKYNLLKIINIISMEKYRKDRTLIIANIH